MSELRPCPFKPDDDEFVFQAMRLREFIISEGSVGRARNEIYRELVFAWERGRARLDEVVTAIRECEQDRLNAQFSGLETGWEHPGTHASFRKILAAVSALAATERRTCECGADAENCKRNREINVPFLQASIAQRFGFSRKDRGTSLWSWE